MCEARKTGKKTHEFPVVSGDAARVICDINGWEFIRVYQPGGDSDRPPGYQAKGRRALSQKQKTVLAREAQKTHRALSNMGIVTDSFDDWRHAQVWACVRREGLTKCDGSHYTKLLGHFRELRGESTVGYVSGTKRQSREGGDSLDRRQQLIHQLAHELGHHARKVDKPETPLEQRCAAHAIEKGGKIGEDYLVKVAAAKNPGQSIADAGDLIKLPASRLEQLLYTMRNRIASREGRGDSRNRDKKQKSSNSGGLSDDQFVILEREARNSHRFLLKESLVTANFDEWFSERVRHATGKDSIRECAPEIFESLKEWFLLMRKRKGGKS